MKTLKPLNATYIYNLYDSTIGLTNIIMKLVTESTILEESDLEEYIKAFDKRYDFPLKNKTLADFKNKRVLIINNRKDYRLPTNIPCFLINSGNKIACVVNVSNYTTIRKSGEVNIDYKVLYSLMQGGTILTKCYEKFQLMKNKGNIIKLGSALYAILFNKVISKMFTLNVTPAKSDIMIFLSSMFFITNMLGRDEDSLEDINIRYALDNCKNSSKLVIEDIIREFDFKKDMKDFNTFIQAIADKVPGLENLSIKRFTEEYMKSFGPLMLFSLEFLPTFIFNLGCVQVGSNLNNQYSIENLLGKEINTFIKDFSSL